MGQSGGENMQVIIKGSTKEIADLVERIQSQPSKVEIISPLNTVKEAMSSAIDDIGEEKQD